MFFGFSKIFDVFSEPLTLCFLGLLTVFLAYHRSWARKALATLLLGIYSLNAPFPALHLLSWLEGKRPDMDTLQPHYDLAIVLTGMTDLPASTPEQLEFTDSVDRILAGIAMLKTGRAAKLLISGGSSSLFGPEDREAIRLKTFALQQGVQEEQLIIEADSRNTYENAVNTAQLLREVPSGRFVLITSAAHMPRAAGVFHKQGLRPDLYPVDFMTEVHIPLTWRSLFPSSVGAQASTRLAHELVGLLIYRLQGYL